MPVLQITKSELNKNIWVFFTGKADYFCEQCPKFMFCQHTYFFQSTLPSDHTTKKVKLFLSILSCFPVQMSWLKMSCFLRNWSKLSEVLKQDQISAYRLRKINLIQWKTSFHTPLTDVCSGFKQTHNLFNSFCISSVLI